MRYHILDWESISESIDKELINNERIIFANVEKFPSVQKLLVYTDILITDFSSILFDFLLLNRPVLFFPYDYEEYNKKVGFTVDYEENTPGPKISSQEQLIFHLSQYLDDPQIDAKWRQKIRDKYNKYADSQSSERIIQKIKEYNILK
jgi:CDP-glycerol glycerophosphotransferase